MACSLIWSISGGVNWAFASRWAPARGNVLALVARQGSIPIAIGLAIGTGGAIALTRVIHSLLYQVSATDPFVFFGVTLALTGVSLAAMAVPARRAASVDPLEALRHE